MKNTMATLAAAVLALVISSGPTPGDGPQMPTSRRVLVLNGLDPVELVGGKEIAGNAKLTIIRGGFRYQFANAQNKATFEARPADYEVQLRGHCARMPGAMGNPELFTVYKRKIYLAGSEMCLQAFHQEPEKYLQMHAAGRKKVAILIFDGVQIIDYTGPYEVFGEAGFEVFTVAQTYDQVLTNMYMNVIPGYSFADCPAADILVVPGGSVHPTPAISAWLKERAKATPVILSVCNGAFFLAEAGLLDGLTVTTTAGNLEPLQKKVPSAKVVWDRRFVDNGKIVTAAGLSAGIDGALHVLEKTQGKGKAQRVALSMEYNWQPEAGYARANLADMHLRKALENIDVPELSFETQRTQGTTDRWESVLEVRGKTSVAELQQLLDSELAKSWAKTDSTAAAFSAWKFTDRGGKPWRATCKVEAVPNSTDVYQVTFELDRLTTQQGRAKVYRNSSTLL